MPMDEADEIHIEGYLDWTSLAVVLQTDYKSFDWDNWANPGLYGWMRTVFHETHHFWQTLSFPSFLSVILEHFTNFYRLRGALSCGKELSIDRMNQEHQQRFHRRDNQYAFSCYDLIEGLSRYWDLHVAGPHRLLKIELGDAYEEESERQGPFEIIQPGYPQPVYTHRAYNYAMLKEDSYRRPFAYLYDALELLEEHREGLVGVLFPFFAFQALSTRNPIEAFVVLCSHAESFFEISVQTGAFRHEGSIEQRLKGLISHFEAWAGQTLTDASIEEDSVVSCYEHFKKLWQEEDISWDEGGQLNRLENHPVLDATLKQRKSLAPYMVPPGNPCLQLARGHEPLEMPPGWLSAYISPDDIARIFMLSGMTDHREILAANFSPPVFIFQHTQAGKNNFWFGMPVGGVVDSKNLDELQKQAKILFTMNRVFTALALDLNDREWNFCPHTTCSLWTKKMCSGVPSIPASPDQCYLKNWIEQDLGSLIELK